MNDPDERKYEPAERKEMNHERPSRNERNKKWMTELKGKKQKMDDPGKRKYEPAERKEINHGRR